MVFYFSGTGNSRYAASIIAANNGDELISINDILRERTTDPYVARYAFQSEQPLVFVSPTYCWRLPRVVEQFILDSRFEGCREAYFFLTCGNGTGDAGKYAKELCKKAELRFMGLSSVIMPENYITLFSAPSFDDAQGIIRASVSSIESTARLIGIHKPITDPNSSAGLGVLGSRFNSFFYKVFVNDKKYKATDDCTGCGRCVESCPTANISLGEDRKPVWHGRCTQCMACISTCPRKAIEYGLSTKGKRRYYLFADGRQRDNG